ncbi:MAG: FKBP-type peptidyl-prolyl cis-trans isomerase [Desulfobulbaceae bacterium]|nr:FKBP-type peptidyl-prolyl cis-trans isomerase [Desulfobulbaceae bacterium]
MKWYAAFVVSIVLAAGMAFTAEKADLQTEEQKFSYAMGLSLGKYFKELEEQFDLNLVQQGIKDGFGGEKALLTEEESQVIQQNFAQRQHDKQVQKTVAMIQKNRKAADDFLAANKGKNGVKTTASGLQYKVIKDGKGAKPTAEDMVRVHYKGHTIDGKEFDSSYKRNEPAELNINQVIPGWQEALLLMPVGSTFELYLPPDLAYGDRGAPPVIEPGSLLIFEVELLDILKEEAKAAAQAETPAADAAKDATSAEAPTTEEKK